MSQSTLFFSGMELAPFVTSTGLLRKSWGVISSSHEDESIISHKGEGLYWKVYEKPFSDLMIIAFEATSEYSFNLQADLIPFSDHREMNFHHFDFLLTRSNPDFSVSSTAFSLFYKNHHMLDEWKESLLYGSTPLIVTGYGLGGSIASLFTISLLDSIGFRKNRPLCITYGSPLIGDKNLQNAMSRFPVWNSCFLHVVSLKDPLPRLFITNHSSSSAFALSPQTNAYMPFGTFLFCSDLNSTCFENPDSILELLIALGSINAQNQGFQSTDYGNIVENLNPQEICEDRGTLAENMPLSGSNSLLASKISVQFQTLGLTTPMLEQQSIDMNTLVTKMEKLERKFIFQKVKRFNPSNRLNQMKMEMAQLEWYKKDSKIKNIGYYDSYKKMDTISSHDVLRFHKTLTNFWAQMLEEAKIKPQKGGASFRKSWLYAGTSYRRMVEPVTIAEYYRNGDKDYITKRPEHFVLLEEWFKNETTKSKTSKEAKAILTLEPSYYLACIDKDLRSRQQSMVVQEMEDYFIFSSDEESDEHISTMLPSFSECVDGLIRSCKDLNFDEEDLNGKSKRINEDNSYFKVRVDKYILSDQGSVKEYNLKTFEALVDKDILSLQGSVVVKEKENNLNRWVGRKRRTMIKAENILTTDSCFWAHVEEALLSCEELKVNKEKEEILKKLVDFEDYVYGLLQNYEVSSDIFLRESSYMRWWNEYKAIKGTSYNSQLASFMNDRSKHVRYSLGAYDFPNSLES